MRRRSAVARVALCAACLVLGSCGFRLQGIATLPASLAAVHIQATDTQSDFYFGLRKALAAAGTQIDDEGKEAGVATIHVLEDSSVEHVLTVSALNVPNEYELIYTMKFSVSSNGHELIAPEEHVLLRDYSYSESALLAKEREKSILSEALAHDLVTVVMRRLSSLTGTETRSP